MVNIKLVIKFSEEEKRQMKEVKISQKDMKLKIEYAVNLEAYFWDYIDRRKKTLKNKQKNKKIIEVLK